MNFFDAVQTMDAHLLKMFGEPCQYRVKGTDTDLSIMAVIQYDLEFYPQYTDVVGSGALITMLCADVSRPQSGDRLTDSHSRAWKILKPLENDDSIVLVAAAVDYRPDII